MTGVYFYIFFSYSLIIYIFMLIYEYNYGCRIRDDVNMGSLVTLLIKTYRIINFESTSNGLSVILCKITNQSPFYLF